MVKRMEKNREKQDAERMMYLDGQVEKRKLKVMLLHNTTSPQPVRTENCDFLRKEEFFCVHQT